MLSTRLKSLTDLRSNPLLVSQIAKDEGAVYILNRNRPVSVMMDVVEYEELMDRLEDAIDALWMKEHEKNKKQGKPLEKVAKELGITLN